MALQHTPDCHQPVSTQQRVRHTCFEIRPTWFQILAVQPLCDLMTSTLLSLCFLIWRVGIMMVPPMCDCGENPALFPSAQHSPRLRCKEAITILSSLCLLSRHNRSPLFHPSHSDLFSVPPTCQAHPQLKASAHHHSQSHHLQTMAVSLLPFQSFLPFLSFSCQIAWAGTSSAALNTRHESRHPRS